MLITEFFDRIYIPFRLRGKSKNSIRLYRLCFRQFDRTLERPAKLADLTDENLLLHLSRRDNVAPATRNKELAELTAIWRFAAQRGLCEGWPTVQPEQEPRRAPVAWLNQELESLLRSAKKQTRTFGNVPGAIWWEGLIRLGLDTGERIEAIRSTKKEWINGDWIIYPFTVRKGKTADNACRLSPPTLVLIRQLTRLAEADRRSELFPFKYSQTYIWYLYREVVKQAGLPVGRSYAFHCLRKTFASVIYAAGLNPQECLDHSDSRTTSRYLDPRFSRKNQPCDALQDYLSGRSKIVNPNSRKSSA